MTQHDEEQGFIKSYLLGELEPEQQRQLEQRLFADDKYFEALLIVEDEIIDQYLGGSLTAPEQERFVNIFLSTPERRRKLNFARALRKYIEVSEPAKPQTLVSRAKSNGFWKSVLPPFLRVQHPAISFSLAVALLLLVIGVTWVAVKNLRQQNQSEAEDPNTVLAVTLTPGAVREMGERETAVVVTDRIKIVRLQLKLPMDEYQSYRAALRVVGGGQEIFTADELKAETIGAGKAVHVSIPSGKLNGGDYQINLSGLDASGRFEGVGRYYFRVVKGPTGTT